MSNLLRGVLSPELLSAVAGHPVRPPVSLVHKRMVGDNRDTRMLLLVERGAGKPFAVLKWATGQAVRDLRKEAGAIRLIRASSNRALAGSCPIVWGPYPVGGSSILTLQRCLPGRSVYAQLRTSPWPRLLVREHLSRTERWLSHFWAALGQPPHPFNEQDLFLHIEEPLRAARERLGAAVVPDSGLRSTLEAARACIGQPVRLVAQHGDLWSANLLVADRLYVVDWEHFRPHALPAFDILFFCTTYGMHFPWRPFGWADHRQAFTNTYLLPSWFAYHVRRFLAACCRRGCLPPGLVPVMLPVSLAHMALRRAPDRAPGQSAAHSQSSWSDMLELWWDRPADNWLEAWANRQNEHPNATN